MAQAQVKTVHPHVWVWWVAAASLLTMRNHNPMYHLLLLLVAQLVGERCAVVETGWRVPVWRVGVFILFFSTLFNGLLAHVGQTVMVRLPVHWPLVGGDITAESAVYGASNGLMLLTLLLIFTTFNRLMPTAELVRLVPRVLRDVGVVLLIGLTYVPETLQQLRRIQEAQAIRGHRLRGLRDWQPVVIPLLVSGLERAMGLAEAMVARGYGQTADQQQPITIRVGFLAGLAATLGGWTLTFWWSVAGQLLMATGVGVIGLLFWQLGRQTSVTRYRPSTWTRREFVLVGTAVLPLFIAFWVAPTSLFYSPYPQLTLPPFDGWVGGAIMGLVAPVLFYKQNWD